MWVQRAWKVRGNKSIMRCCNKNRRLLQSCPHVPCLCPASWPGRGNELVMDRNAGGIHKLKSRCMLPVFGRLLISRYPREFRISTASSNTFGESILSNQAHIRGIRVWCVMFCLKMKIRSSELWQTSGKRYVNHLSNRRHCNVFFICGCQFTQFNIYRWFSVDYITFFKNCGTQ